MNNGKMGKLIAFEGPDCAGKSSIIEKLKIALPVIYDDKFSYTREPGNNFRINDRCQDIRIQLLTDESLNSIQQAELFAESRYLHTYDIIDELKKGRHVITDRYIFSSLFYQGPILGFEKVMEYNKKALNLLIKNNIELNTIAFQITPETYYERIKNRNESEDAMEKVEEVEILTRIDYYNNIQNFKIDNFVCKNVYSIDANTKDYSQIFIDSLNTINNIIRKED